jgi:hypothetical protein
MVRKWAVLITVAVVLIAIAAGVNLVLAGGLSSSADSRLQRLATDQSRAISVNEGQVSLPTPSGGPTDLGSQAWVFVSGQTVAGPTGVAPDIAAAAKALDGKPSQFVDVPGQEVRLHGVPLYFQDKQIGTVVTGLSMASYHRAQRLTFIATGGFIALVLIIVGFAGFWVRRTRPGANKGNRDPESVSADAIGG